jgi:hypothetical protein
MFVPPLVHTFPPESRVSFAAPSAAQPAESVENSPMAGTIPQPPRQHRRNCGQKQRNVVALRLPFPESLALEREELSEHHQRRNNRPLAPRIPTARWGADWKAQQTPSDTRPGKLQDDVAIARHTGKGNVAGVSVWR